jgi:hypothetical protein
MAAVLQAHVCDKSMRQHPIFLTHRTMACLEELGVGRQKGVSILLSTFPNSLVKFPKPEHFPMRLDDSDAFSLSSPRSPPYPYFLPLTLRKQEMN